MSQSQLAEKSQEDSSNQYLSTIVGNKADVKWEHLLAPAPMGIAIMSQLMICASLVNDMKLIKKDSFTLIRHPESFRATLVQIGNDAYNAFRKAHSNMERIQLEMAQVPGYIRGCVQVLKSGNGKAVEKFLPLRLKRIQEAAVNGETLSKEVSDGFNQLMETISQVLESTSLSVNDNEKEILKSIKDALEEDKIRQEKAKEKEQKYLDDRRKAKEEEAKLAQEHLMKAKSRDRKLLERIFFPNEKERSIELAQEMVEDADKRLEQTKKEAAKVEEGLKKINKEYMKSLEDIQISANQVFGQDEAIQLLRKGMNSLSELKSKWAGLAQYFQSINNIIKTTTSKNLTDFKDEAEAAKDDTSLLNFMGSTIMKSSESSHLTHRIADMYVKVSNNYIMNNVASMQKMIALKEDQVQAAQKELMANCQLASDGIVDMVKKDKFQLIRSMEDYKEQCTNEIEKLGITELN